jgi:hypothetical protein
MNKMTLVETYDRRSPYAYTVFENGVPIALVYRADTGGWGFWKCDLLIEGE